MVKLSWSYQENILLYHNLLNFTTILLSPSTFLQGKNIYHKHVFLRDLLRNRYASQRIPTSLLSYMSFKNNRYIIYTYIYIYIGPNNQKLRRYRVYKSIFTPYPSMFFFVFFSGQRLQHESKLDDTAHKEAGSRVIAKLCP